MVLLIEMVKKTLTGLLTALFFFSNVVFLYATETSVWKERRRNLDAGLEGQPPTQLASLGGASQPTVSSPKVDFWHQVPELGKALEDFASRRPIKSQVPVPPLLLPYFESISLNAGSVREVYIPPTFVPGESGPPFVFLIQDVHQNYEAQKNIARIFESLNSVQSGLGVGVEGAFGPFDFGKFRVFPDKKLTADVADFFLKEGRIAAPSFVGITTPKTPPEIFGIDNLEHYRANVEAYLDSQKQKGRIQKRLSSWKTDLSLKMSQDLNPRLRRFVEVRESYQRGDIHFGAYVEKLARAQEMLVKPTAEVDLYPHEFVLERFLSAYELEHSLDFSRVERERARVIEKLALRLTPKDLKTLAATGLAFQMGKISYADYYRDIQEFLQRYGVSLSDAPAFRRYLQYIMLTDSLQAEPLLKAVRQLEEGISNSLVKNEKEREFIQMSRSLYLVEKLLDFALVPEEWEEYKKVRHSGESRNPDVVEGLDPRLRGDDDTLSSFEAFYREADLRSEKLTDNFIGAFTADAPPQPKGCPITALLVGGFHTPKLTRLLKERGWPYAVIQPKVTKLDGKSGSEYLSIFTREKASLDHLFSGNKLFLAPAMVHTGTGLMVDDEFLAVNGLIAAIESSTEKGRRVYRFSSPKGEFFGTSDLSSKPPLGYERTGKVFRLPNHPAIELLSRRDWIETGFTGGAVFLMGNSAPVPLSFDPFPIIASLVVVAVAWGILSIIGDIGKVFRWFIRTLFPIPFEEALQRRLNGQKGLARQYSQIIHGNLDQLDGSDLAGLALTLYKSWWPDRDLVEIVASPTLYRLWGAAFRKAPNNQRELIYVLRKYVLPRVDEPTELLAQLNALSRRDSQGFWRVEGFWHRWSLKRMRDTLHRFQGPPLTLPLTERVGSFFVRYVLPLYGVFFGFFSFLRWVLSQKWVQKIVPESWPQKINPQALAQFLSVNVIFASVFEFPLFLLPFFASWHTNRTPLDRAQRLKGHLFVLAMTNLTAWTTYYCQGPAWLAVVIGLIVFHGLWNVIARAIGWAVLTMGKEPQSVEALSDNEKKFIVCMVRLMEGKEMAKVAEVMKEYPRTPPSLLRRYLYFERAKMEVFRQKKKEFLTFLIGRDALRKWMEPMTLAAISLNKGVRREEVRQMSYWADNPASYEEDRSAFDFRQWFMEHEYGNEIERLVKAIVAGKSGDQWVKKKEDLEELGASLTDDDMRRYLRFIQDEGAAQVKVRRFLRDYEPYTALLKREFRTKLEVLKNDPYTPRVVFLNHHMGGLILSNPYHFYWKADPEGENARSRYKKALEALDDYARALSPGKAIERHTTRREAEKSALAEIQQAKKTTSLDSSGTVMTFDIQPETDLDDARRIVKEKLEARNGRSALQVSWKLDMKNARLRVKFQITSSVPVIPLEGSPPRQYENMLKAVAMALDLLFSDMDRHPEILEEANQLEPVMVTYYYERPVAASVRKILGGIWGEKRTTFLNLESRVRSYFIIGAGENLRRYVDSDLVRDVINTLGQKSGDWIDLVSTLETFLKNVYRFETATDISEFKNALIDLKQISYKFAKAVDVGRVEFFCKEGWFLDEEEPIGKLDPSDGFRVEEKAETPEAFMNLMRARKEALPPRPLYIFKKVFTFHDRLWLLVYRQKRFELYYTSKTYSLVAGQHQWEKNEAGMVVQKHGEYDLVWYAKPQPNRAHDLTDAASAEINRLISEGALRILPETVLMSSEVFELHVDLGLAFMVDGVAMSRNELGQVAEGNPYGVAVNFSRYNWEGKAAEINDEYLQHRSQAIETQAAEQKAATLRGRPLVMDQDVKLKMMGLLPLKRPRAPGLTLPETVEKAIRFFFQWGIPLTELGVRFYASVAEVFAVWKKDFEEGHFADGLLPRTKANRRFVAMGTWAIRAATVAAPLLSTALAVRGGLAVWAALSLAAASAFFANVFVHAGLNVWAYSFMDQRIIPESDLEILRAVQRSIVKRKIDRGRLGTQLEKLLAVPPVVKMGVGRKTVGMDRFTLDARDQLLSQITENGAKLEDILPAISLLRTRGGQIKSMVEAVEESVSAEGGAVVAEETPPLQTPLMMVRVMDPRGDVAQEVGLLTRLLGDKHLGVLVVGDNQETALLQKRFGGNRLRFLRARDYPRLSNQGLTDMFGPHLPKIVKVFVDQKAQFRIPQGLIEALIQLSREGLSLDLYLTVGTVKNLIAIPMTLSQWTQMNLMRERLLQIQA
ncbi:MAG: hypothetical protein LHV69_08680 [Elusimicrobia bacterium]|nr:hypothetical protein [Candidatus Obscuribacterium magneticum]